MKTNILLSFLILNIVCFAQKSPKSVEADLKKQFQKIYYWDEHQKMDDTLDTYDSMQRANNYILNQIVKHGYHNQAFLNYPFHSLVEFLDVTTSKDKSFRIYSWDTYTGGTMHIFFCSGSILRR